MRKHLLTRICQAFDWDTIPDGHLLVDVGGGLGHVSMEVAKVHPNIHVVIEDREAVLKKAKPVGNIACRSLCLYLSD